MNEKIKNHVSAFNEKKGWGTTLEGVIDTIQEATPIYSEVVDSRRWWDETFVVVEIDGMLIGYNGATTTGDDSAYDKGWEFDPSSICEVKSEEVTVVKTVYTPIS